MEAKTIARVGFYAAFLTTLMTVITLSILFRRALVVVTPLQKANA